MQLLVAATEISMIPTAFYGGFDQKTGHEFSAVLGFTGDFQNQSTGYTSSIDSHILIGAHYSFCQPTGRLECLADLWVVAGGAVGQRFSAADHYQNAP